MITKNNENEAVINLINNDALFNNILVVQEKFDILPDKDHIGASITYKDIKICETGFLEELYDSVVDWVYGIDKYNELIKSRKKITNKSDASIASEIQRRALNKFRVSDERLLIQGQMGELLLFHFIERFFKAQPLLRKMPITTSPDHERFGADAIHYKKDNNKNIIYLGESKCYTSKYQFTDAFANSIESILKTYENLEQEIDLYMCEDFLDEAMKIIAQKYKDNTLENVEIHLVCLVMYNENRKLKGDTEDVLKSEIIKVIKERLQFFDNKKIDLQKYSILKRINYIVFPIWELDKVADKFSKMICSGRC